jgi:hypothetical protein
MDPVTEWLEYDLGVSWIESGRLVRTSHALAREGQVWLMDPFETDGLDARIRALGTPAGVLQLLDRHARDCGAIAARLGVPHHVVPFAAPPGVPFAFVPVLRRKRWQETALWWPEERLLACAEAVGTARFFRARSDAVGVHPLLRLTPPRALLGLEPLHLLCGHGVGVHGSGTASALTTAIRTSRRRAPAAFLNGLRG